MSVELTGRVWQCGPTDPRLRLVLLALVDGGVQDDGSCHPSTKTLLTKTCMSPAELAGAIQALHRDGWLVAHGRGRFTILGLR